VESPVGGKGPEDEEGEGALKDVVALAAHGYLASYT
jgi:hypothetical protein